MWRHRVEHSAACFAQFDCNGVGLVQLDGPAYVLDALFLFFVFSVLCAGATGWPCVLDALFFFLFFSLRTSLTLCVILCLIFRTIVLVRLDGPANVLDALPHCVRYDYICSSRLMQVFLCVCVASTSVDTCAVPTR